MPPEQQKAQRLFSMYERIRNCKKCSLCQHRSKVVCGEGNPNARIVFVGEFPGPEEDKTGRPFEGEHGTILTDIIEKAMKLPRQDVFITSAVKCITPNERDPNDEEKSACGEYLLEEIETIAPEVIVAVGRIAAYALWQIDGVQPLGSPRGKWKEFRGIPFMTIYHPSYLLKQRLLGFGPEHRTQEDRKTWYDIKQVMEKLGLPV